MADAQLPELTPAQVAVLEKLLCAGFRFVTLERFARYPALEKQGFIALLDTEGGKVKIFGQTGYHMGEGIGMLVERGSGKTFVWHEKEVEATRELLAGFEKFKLELSEILQDNEPAAGSRN